MLQVTAYQLSMHDGGLNRKECPKLHCFAQLGCQDPSAWAGPCLPFSNYREAAITQLCAKASSTRVADFYVMRLFLTCIYSEEYTDKQSVILS